MKLNQLHDWIDLFDQSFCDERPYDLVRAGGVVGPALLPEMVARANALLKTAWSKDATVQDVDLLWFASNALKKFSVGEGVTKELATQAISGWIERNRLIGENLPWWVEIEARKLLARALPEPSTYESVKGRFGPGSIREGLNTFARWNLVSQFPFDVRKPEEGLNLLGDDIALVGRNCRSARICAVPKDAWKARTITVEPAWLSFAQQWAREVLRMSVHSGCLTGTVMDTLGVYERHFEIQGERCITSSRTGRMATIDLKDASDTIGWAQMHRIFPAWVCRTVTACRAPYVTLPDGSETEVRMYAGMGNATTYVVETLYFWAIVTAISLRLRDETPVYVVGDDIICGTAAASNPLFSAYLRECGIIVNGDKSFARGTTFRESCGVAAFNGQRLPTLNRIAGYDTEHKADVIRACGLVTRLRESQSRAQQWLGESLSAEAWVPGNSYYPVDSECDFTVVPGEGEWGRVRWTSHRDEQRRCISANCLAGKEQAVKLYSLNESEFLGVLQGAITDGRDGGHVDTVIRIPLRNQTRVVRRRLAIAPSVSAAKTLRIARSGTKNGYDSEVPRSP